MIKTKIICTIGPSSESPETLLKLAEKGMNLARLNFSHGDHEEHLKRIKVIQEINKKLPIPIAMILDTQGPEIRLGEFKEKSFLKEGSVVILTTKDIMCDEKMISISYKKLPQTVVPDDFVYIADGTIELLVKKVVDQEVYCEVIVGGEVNTRKNVSIPDKFIDLPAISEKDKKDIEFGAKHGIDFVAQSFVKTAQDVLDMKKLLADNGSDAHVIAKIECPEGVKNIDEIIDASDAIMVARGDLGVQIPIEQVPNAQKMIIQKSNCLGKPVIVATQMLESMTKSPRPTRAEVTDVANAIMDGADAIMLSGETAAGKYPIRAVEMMVKVARQTEAKLNFEGLCEECGGMKIDNAIARAVCQTAYDTKAKAIITCTYSGHTARLISENRPIITIIAVTPNVREIKKLNICWGVHPLHIPDPASTDDLIQNAIDSVAKAKLVASGDTVVITAGIPFHVPGNVNLMKVHVI